MKNILLIVLLIVIIVGAIIYTLGVGTFGTDVSAVDSEIIEDLEPSATTTETEAPATQTVQLFYYNPELDKDETGNIMCSRYGLVPVTREVSSITPIEDTLRLLIAGELTAEERAAGITTEYPLPGVALNSVALQPDGELVIELSDPQNTTVGGSCRAAILWGQIRQTALQFSVVKEVSFQPEDLFQP